jgi:hypothetical protein
MRPPLSTPRDGRPDITPSRKERPEGEFAARMHTPIHTPLVHGAPSRKPGSKLMASASKLVHDGEFDKAKATLQTILELNPENLQARSMLELISMAEPKKKKGGRGWIVLLVLALLLGGGTAAAVLIKVPGPLVLPCTAERVPLAEVSAPFAGEIDKAAEAGEEVVRGQLLVELVNRKEALELARLRARLESDEELLRIMKKSGSPEDEKHFKEQQEELAQEQAKLKNCAGDDCGNRQREVIWQLEQVKLKLKFCEWEALPKEIAAAEAKLEQLRQQVAGKASRAPVKRVQAPLDALVTKIAQKGTKVAEGSVLVSLVHARRLDLLTRSPAPRRPAKGEAVTVRLAGVGQELQGRVEAVRSDSRVVIAVTTDAAVKQLKGRCSARFERLGKITLARMLRNRLLK